MRFSSLELDILQQPGQTLAPCVAVVLKTAEAVDGTVDSGAVVADGPQHRRHRGCHLDGRLLLATAARTQHTGRYMRHRPHVSRCKASSRHSCVELSRACELIPAPPVASPGTGAGGRKLHSTQPATPMFLLHVANNCHRNTTVSIVRSCIIFCRFVVKFSKFKSSQFLGSKMLQKWSMRPQLRVF